MIKDTLQNGVEGLQNLDYSVAIVLGFVIIAPCVLLCVYTVLNNILYRLRAKKVRDLGDEYMAEVVAHSTRAGKACLVCSIGTDRKYTIRMGNSLKSLATYPVGRHVMVKVFKRNAVFTGTAGT